MPLLYLLLICGVIPWVLYLSFVFLAPIAFVVAGMTAAGLVLVEYVSASSAVFSRGAPIERIRIAPSHGSRDPAYRSYFCGPVLYDYRSMVGNAAGRASGLIFSAGGYERPGSAPDDRDTRPLMSRMTGWWIEGGAFVKGVGSGAVVGGVAGLLAGGVLAWLFTMVVSLVFGAVLLLVVLTSITLAVTLRLIESVSLKARGITLECPSCQQHLTRPAYLCAHCPPGDPTIHHNLVPGTKGVLRRICRCGNPLPTLLIGGKWRLESRCQREQCQKLLPVKAQTAATFHVPVVAGTAAGKTVLMMAATATLETRARAADSDQTFEFADPGAKSQYVEARKALEAAAFNAINPTLPGVDLRAYTVYVGGAGSRRRLLYMYDSAGERYEDRERLDGAAFLKLTQGVVLVVDPFALDPVRELAGRVTLASVTMSSVDPEQVFSRFGQSLRAAVAASPNRKLNVPAAVVITKADALLRASAVPHPLEGLGDEALDPTERAARSQAVRDWLVDVAAQRSMVAMVESTFSRSSYFVVSALDAFTVSVRHGGRRKSGVKHDDPSAPIRWLLDGGRAP